MVNNNGYRPRRHRRVTGRFYAFLTVALVLVVMVSVLVANRRGASPTLSPATTTAPTYDPSSIAADGTPTALPVTGEPADSGSGVMSIDELLELNPDIAPLSGDDMVDVSNLSVTPGLSPDWQNILLLGSDSRNIKKVARTDTIMIASVNTKTGQVKLTSIMRDLNVPLQMRNGSVKNGRINSAIYYGQAPYVIKLVNELFGMNITDYVMVNFASFQKVIDILDGIRIDVTEKEMEEINGSLGEQAKVAGLDQQWFIENKESLKLKVHGGDVRLTGIQALGYARIRHVGAGDYQRTERQRAVLEAVLKEVKNANAIKLAQLATAMWGEFDTSLKLTDAIGVATSVIRNGAKMDTAGRIPGKDTFTAGNRNGTYGLWDCDFEANKEKLYAYIYG